MSNGFRPILADWGEQLCVSEQVRVSEEQDSLQDFSQNE